MENSAAELKKEIELAATALGIAPSTVGMRAGQGGKFYARLCEGKRIWPETATAVRTRISQMLTPSLPQKRGNAKNTRQPSPCVLQPEGE